MNLLSGPEGAAAGLAAGTYLRTALILAAGEEGLLGSIARGIQNLTETNLSPNVKVFLGLTSALGGAAGLLLDNPVMTATAAFLGSYYGVGAFLNRMDQDLDDMMDGN